MIIFGVKNKIVKNKNETSDLFDCNHCNSLKTVRAVKTFKYFHIFWIPIFPYSKKISTQCSHCKNLKYQNEINEHDLSKIKSKLSIKIPLKYSFGLILVGLFIAAMIFAGITSNMSINKNIKNPKIGDVYEIKYKKEKQRLYTMYRIISIQKDSITFELNDFEVTSIMKLNELRKQHKNDYTERLTIAKSENIKNKQNIINIVRNKD